MFDKNHHPCPCHCGWSSISSTSSSLWWLMVSWESCPTVHPRICWSFVISLPFVRTLFLVIYPSCNPLNPDRQERADLYSSGPTHNLTVWKERRSEREWIRKYMCVRDIYLRVHVHVQVCATLWIFVCVGRLYVSFTHPELPKLISLFMREASGKRRQMKT